MATLNTFKDTPADGHPLEHLPDVLRICHVDQVVPVLVALVHLLLHAPSLLRPKAGVCLQVRAELVQIRHFLLIDGRVLDDLLQWDLCNGIRQSSHVSPSESNITQASDTEGRKPSDATCES